MLIMHFFCTLFHTTLAYDPFTPLKVVSCLHQFDISISVVETLSVTLLASYHLFPRLYIDLGYGRGLTDILYASTLLFVQVFFEAPCKWECVYIVVAVLVYKATLVLIFKPTNLISAIDFVLLIIGCLMIFDLKEHHSKPSAQGLTVYAIFLIIFMYRDHRAQTNEGVEHPKTLFSLVQLAFKAAVLYPLRCISKYPV